MTKMKRTNLHGPNVEVNVVAVQIIGDVTAQPGPSLLIIIIIFPDRNFTPKAFSSSS